jgi:hypothetical protein
VLMTERHKICVNVGNILAVERNTILRLVFLAYTFRE